MKERPILFQGAMVRAILTGTKTQTRRVIKPHGAVDLVRMIGADDEPTGEWGWCPHPRYIAKYIRCPYGQPGDRLWVREAFGWFVDRETIDGRSVELGRDPVYRADNPTTVHTRWLPSIHMPRELSRITLEITDVRVERLQDISEADAKAEGCTPDGRNDPARRTYRTGFRCLWEDINGAGSWDANPYVWVVAFRRVT